MPQAAPATQSSDSPTLDGFLRGVERHALRMAELALPQREDALATLQDALPAFVRSQDRQPEGAWPLLFWRAFHDCLDTRPHRRGAADASDPDAAARPASFLQLDAAAATASLDAALRALPPGQRQAFLLRVWEEFDIARTALAMNASEASIKTELFGALRGLRTRLDADPAPATPATPAPRDDGRWILRCRALLDASARALDTATLARLERMRQAALAPPAPRPARGGRGLAWVGGLALAVGLALMLSRLLPAPTTSQPPSPSAPSAVVADPVAAPPPSIAPSEDTPLAAPDFDLLVDGEEEAMLAELEFYAWLNAGGDRGG